MMLLRDRKCRCQVNGRLDTGAALAHDAGVGDIGTERREVEFEPLPAEAQPEPAPQPLPSEPQKEPAPA